MTVKLQHLLILPFYTLNIECANKVPSCLLPQLALGLPILLLWVILLQVLVLWVVVLWILLLRVLVLQVLLLQVRLLQILLLQVLLLQVLLLLVLLLQILLLRVLLLQILLLQVLLLLVSLHQLQLLLLVSGASLLVNLVLLKRCTEDMVEILVNNFPIKLHQSFIAGYRAFLTLQRELKKKKANLSEDSLRSLAQVLKLAAKYELSFGDVQKFRDTCVAMDHQVRNVICSMMKVDANVAWFSEDPSEELWFSIYQWIEKNVDNEVRELSTLR